ncbi:hypothetical protein DIE14_13820 [Burkholderia sp. Bp9017]|uniref:N-ATPase subunit AtpR n=1 Tax=Burkholderia TaxID=32008 RepID=UPI000F5F84C6|nr:MULTISPECIES: ATP synthase subunit I [Burkholderia]MBY4868874.1 hypothetical protein [Burkholderia anthina]RQZ26941.1 hypothetical protein DIE14_13820 [Burkholderia sp. Bp9017]
MTIDAWLSPNLAAAMLGVAAGLALGAWHFGSLAWNCRLFAAGRVACALGLQGARIAIAVAVLVALARIGAAAVVAGALGLLVARAVALRYADASAALRGLR